MNNQDANIILNGLKSSELAKTLEIMRRPILKLSEINISKTNFNIWKKEGYLESIFSTATKTTSWQTFSISQLIIILIVNTLWQHRMVNNIKEYVDELMDSKQLDDFINSILEDESQAYLKSTTKNGNMDLFAYLAMQKKENPNLPPMTWIEAFSIASTKLNRPYSLFVFEDGKVVFYSTTIMSDFVGFKFDPELLKKTFLNIAFSSLINNLLDDNRHKKSNVYLNESNIIDALLSKGYTLDSINDVFFENKTELDLVDERVYNREKDGNAPPKVEHVLSSVPNQNVLIKVRDGKKISIDRLIIKAKS